MIATAQLTIIVITILLAADGAVYPAWAGTQTALPASPSELLAKAKGFETAKRYHQAISMYRAYLAARPEDDEVRGALARVLSWQGEYDEAAALYQDILARHPTDLDVQTALARVRSWQHRWDEAQRLYQEVLREAPQHPEAKRGLADTLYWSGDYALALRHYQEIFAATHDPEIAQRIEAVRIELINRASLRAPIGAEAGIERQGPSLPYREYFKLGYTHLIYSNNIPDERDWLFEGGAALGSRTVIGRVERLDRFGSDAVLLSGELYSPLWGHAWGYLGAAVGFGPEFVPRWRVGGELFQGLGVLHSALSPVELSFGYRRLSFSSSDVDIYLPGLTIYLPYNTWLTEKIYIVPETNSKTLASQLNWRVTNRLQVFASGAFGTVGERIATAQDLLRVDTTTIQAGLILPLARRFSLEAIGYYEDRNTLYRDGGMAFNLLVHW